MMEMKNVVALAESEGIRDQVKIMIGGAPVTQSYCDTIGADCYTADAVRGLLTVLLKGENANAYTVVNPATSMPIREVAKLVSDTLTDGQTKIIFDIPESALTYGYAPDVTMRLSGDKLMGLGWQPEVDLPEMFRRLAASFRAQEGA